MYRKEQLLSQLAFQHRSFVGPQVNVCPSMLCFLSRNAESGSAHQGTATVKCPSMGWIQLRPQWRHARHWFRRHRDETLTVFTSGVSESGCWGSGISIRPALILTRGISHLSRVRGSCSVTEDSIAIANSFSVINNASGSDHKNELKTHVAQHELCWNLSE